MTKLGYVISGIIGAAGGVVVGYIVYAVAQDASGAVAFGYWLKSITRHSSPYWALVGCLTGLGLRFLAATR